MKFLKKHKIFVILIIFILLIGLVTCIHSILSSKVDNSSIRIDTKSMNGYIIQENIKNNAISEEILDDNNCIYEVDDDAEVTLTQCLCDKDCIIVPEEIDGYKLDKIDEKAFANNENIELIKIPKKIANNIDSIENFEPSNISTDEQFITYSTTKEYNEDYLNYIKLSNQEKEKYELIPKKFLTPISSIYSNTSNNIATNYGIPYSFDLRDYINIQVEDQGPFGICYACTTLKSVETNIALTHHKLVDFSDLHLALLTSGGSRWFI